MDTKSKDISLKVILIIIASGIWLDGENIK